MLENMIIFSFTMKDKKYIFPNDVKNCVNKKKEKLKRITAILVPFKAFG